MPFKDNAWFNDHERMKKIHKFVTDQMESDRAQLTSRLAYLDEVIYRKTYDYGSILTAVAQHYKDREGFDPEWDLDDK